MNRRSFLAAGLGTALTWLAGCSSGVRGDREPDPLPPDPTLQWLHQYGDEGASEEFTTLLSTDDGGFFAGGGRTQSDYAAFLVRTDRNGEKRWTRVFENRPVRDAVATPDGGFLVLVGRADMGDPELHALAGDGTTQWRRRPKPHQSPRYEFDRLLRTHDGYLLVGTQMEVAETTDEYVSQRWNPVVLAVTARGRERWERVFTAPDVTVGGDEQGNVTYGPGTERAKDIVHAGDGYLLLCETSEAAPYLRRLDATGTEIWRRDYSRGHNGSLSVIAPGPEGYVLAGTDAGMAEEAFITGAWLLAIDHDGEPLWSYAYPFVDEEHGGAFTVTDLMTDTEGAPVVAGSYHPDGHWNYRTRPVLARFGPDGSVVHWVRQYGDRGGGGGAVVQAGDGSFVLAGHIDVMGSWTDALLLDAGRPSESNVEQLRVVEIPTEPTSGQ